MGLWDMESAEIPAAIKKIAAEIAAATPNAEDIVILGIPNRGVPLAKRIAQELHAINPQFDPAMATGQLDVTMHRDDLRRHPTRLIGPTKAPAIDCKTVILVDDVFASGRTIRAALEALNELGRPDVVRLAVLIERNMRQLPISPDYVGGYLPAEPTERVSVRLVETDGADAVIIEPVRR